jgi:hypothetical protein
VTIPITTFTNEITEPEVAYQITKPLSETALKELKIDISNLWRQGKKSRFLIGQKLALLHKERARGRTGTFMRDLQEMRIGYHTANRLIKFYRRAQFFQERKAVEDAHLAAKWGGIEEARAFELALQSQEADDRLAALNVLADVEREKVRQAQVKSNNQPVRHRFGITLSEEQFDKFTKKWGAMTETFRSALVYEAVMNDAR